jgi:redox-sensing transcriptional repressor
MEHRLTERAIARLVIYRRLLERLRDTGTEYVFSHTLAGPARVTAAQVRRDVMDLEYLGNPAKGYRVVDLLERIARMLDPKVVQTAVLAGAGRLGGALMSYFNNWSPRLQIVGIFDSDPAKIGHDFHGHPCRKLADLPKVVRKHGVDVGILAVPAEAAPDVARMMVGAGVKGIMNFAPLQLDVPPDVFVEQVDLTVSIERVAYMARLAGASAAVGTAGEAMLNGSNEAR